MIRVTFVDAGDRVSGSGCDGCEKRASDLHKCLDLMYLNPINIHTHGNANRHHSESFLPGHRCVTIVKCSSGISLRRNREPSVVPADDEKAGC